MGMFDDIQGEVKCLNCGEEFIADDQIKWADCELHQYNVGDSIPAKDGDGEYDWGSYARPTLDTQCPKCNTWQHFKAVVKGGVLTKLETTSVYTEREMKELDEWCQKIVENDRICMNRSKN